MNIIEYKPQNFIDVEWKIVKPGLKVHHIVNGMIVVTILSFTSAYGIAYSFYKLLTW
jgi:hypothetical protein